jgi:hypothetical protein
MLSISISIRTFFSSLEQCIVPFSYDSSLTREHIVDQGVLPNRLQRIVRLERHMFDSRVTKKELSSDLLIYHYRGETVLRKIT